MICLSSVASSYWARIILGLIAGLMLAELIPLKLFGGSQEVSKLTKPLLALLGGFSATIVHRILTKIIEMIESVFKANVQDTVDAAVADESRRSEENLFKQKMGYASNLVEIQNMLKDSSTDPEVAKKVDTLILEMQES